MLPIIPPMQLYIYYSEVISLNITTLKFPYWSNLTDYERYNLIGQYMYITHRG